MTDKAQNPKSEVQNSKSSVLIVEDEALIATYLKHMLTESGYDVLGTFASGEKALQLMEACAEGGQDVQGRSKMPDLVLMDIKLAGKLDGIETAAQIRERFGIPVVYLTGYGEEMVMQRARATEPFGYVSKPTRERELRATIEMALYRHALETRLKESEKRFRQLAENIREVFWLGSPDWNQVIYISPAYEEVWGRSCESLYKSPRSWLDAIVEEDREQVIAAINRKTTGDLSEPELPEYRIVRPDGSVRWILARAFPIRNERGEVYRIAGIAEDITERKRAEEALRESEERYRALTENSPNGIFISDAERFIYVNQRLCEITGFSRDELLNMPDPVGVLCTPEERERVLSYALSRLGGDPTPTGYKVRGIRKNGEEFQLKLTVSLIVLAGKRVLQGTIEDITERVRAEASAARERGKVSQPV